MKATIKNLQTLPVPNPDFGDLTLNLYPLKGQRNIELPAAFSPWNVTVNNILNLIPEDRESSNEHYVTIDSKFFTKPETLRREGIHIDGNFCADPYFIKKTWGGTTTVPTWAGAKLVGAEVITDWVSPYGVKIPIGTYVSDEKGGIFCVSSEVGCQAWSGEFDGQIGDQGDFSELQHQLQSDKKVVFEKDQLYFMTSNTPHETLLIDKGVRRTFIRVTLAHDYNNRLIN